MRNAKMIGQLSAVLLGAGVLAISLAACQSSPSSSPSSSESASATSGSPAESSSSAPAQAMPTSSAGRTGAPAQPSSSAATSTAQTSLHISIVDSPGADPRSYLLNCEGTQSADGSTVADPGAACAAVRAAEPSFFPDKQAAKQQCAAQYAGPAVAHVTGHIGERVVDATFAQTDGCEIAAWNALAPLFGAKAGDR